MKVERYGSLSVYEFVVQRTPPGGVQVILVCGGGEAGTRGKRVGLISDEIGTSRKVEIPSACHRTGGGDGFI